MKHRIHGGAMAAAVTLLAVMLMLTHFASGVWKQAPMERLETSRVVTGLGHQSEENPVDINTASAEELDRLPGIGPAKAAAIIAWREEHGPFRYPEELIQVSGIGEGIMSEILAFIVVGGE